MDPSIRFRCPGCRARIKAPAQLIGQTRSCPGCGRRLLVQMSPPEDLGPVLLSDDTPAPVPRRFSSAF
ncbi:MAG TPA: hypothetical protein VKA46_40580 [Gemmataceae bacterium]|nr:hypothetical protein [Gemmataceae bacterium]